MTTGTRRRMGVEERREQLIAVALDLFSHRSPEDVSIDEVAEAAGISRPLVYHYFPGKQQLYEAALRRAAEELTARFVEPHEGPLGARLLRVMERLFDFVEEHGPGFSALMRGGPAIGSTRTSTMIDGVRHAAYVQILAHLGIPDPAPGWSWWSAPGSRWPRPPRCCGWTGGRSPARSWNGSWCTTSRRWRR